MKPSKGVGYWLSTTNIGNPERNGPNVKPIFSTIFPGHNADVETETVKQGVLFDHPLVVPPGAAPRTGKHTDGPSNLLLSRLPFPDCHHITANNSIIFHIPSFRGRDRSGMWGTAGVPVRPGAMSSALWMIKTRRVWLALY